jgi:predicted nuclease with TOPRIM domain
MSLSKPEINYDTALYALQENVVLKQRLEEKDDEHDKRIKEAETKYDEIVLHLNRCRYLESVAEDKLDKALYDVTYLQNKLDPIAKQRDKVLGKMYAAMVLAAISFCLNLYLIFSCYTWS